MVTDPLAEQNATVNSFMGTANANLDSLAAKLPKTKQVNPSKWGDLQAALTKRGDQPTDSGQSTPSAVTPGITDQGADVRQLGPVTTPYGASTRYEGVHPGIDIGAPIGKPLPSFRSGTVENVSSGQEQGDKGFGNSVWIKDAQGNSWRYSHLDRSWVKKGDSVKAGQQIGTIGNTGAAYSEHGGTGSHLDLRIADAYGRFINPKNMGLTY